MAKRKTKKNVVSVNFKGVTTFKTPNEGDYLIRVAEVEEGVSRNDNEMLSWTFEIADGDFEGSKLFYTTVLSKDSLWKLREVLEALGQDVPDGKLDIDLKELIGCECGATVFHETYEGKKKAKIADFLLADEVDGSEDYEDDEESNEDDEDDIEEVDIGSMDEDELEEFIDDNGLDVDLDDYSTIKKKRKAVQEAFDSEDEDDEEDEDEVTYSENQIKKMKKDQLEELNEDLDLEIDDIDEMTKKKAVRKVIKALKEKELFED